MNGSLKFVQLNSEQCYNLPCAVFTLQIHGAVFIYHNHHQPVALCSSYLSVIPSATERLCTCIKRSYMIWSCISNPSLPLEYSLHPDHSIGLIYTQPCRYYSNTDSFTVNSIQARGIRWQKHDSCSHILFYFQTESWFIKNTTSNTIATLSSPSCLIAYSTLQAVCPTAFLYWKFDI